MSLSRHFRNECEFGFTHAQCRCPAPGKTVVHITCDRVKEHDPRFRNAPQERADAPDGRLSGGPTPHAPKSPFGPIASGLVAPKQTSKMFTIPPHSPESLRYYGKECEHLAAGLCYWCCQTCNLDDHRCGGCGRPLDHNGMEFSFSPPEKRKHVCL